MKPSNLLWTLFILLVVYSVYFVVVLSIILTRGSPLDLSDYFFFAAMASIGWVVAVFFVLVLQKERREKA